MWHILSMADGQGSALGSGSIPGMPLPPPKHFLKRPVEIWGVLGYNGEKCM